MAADHDVESSIPVIDISKHSAETADELIAAVVKWGFVFIQGDVGFTFDEIDSIFRLVSCF